MKKSLFSIERYGGVSSLWVGLSVVAVCAVIIVLSLRARGEMIDERDFSLGKVEQLRKVRRFLAADSVDAALIVLNMIVGDVEAKKKISAPEAESIVEAYLLLGDIYSKRESGYNDYGKAYSSYKKAVAMAEVHSLKPQLAKALLGLGVKYEIQLSSYDDASLTDTLLSTLRRSLLLAMESESWRTADMAMKNLASAAYSRGRGKEIADDLRFYRQHDSWKDDADGNHKFVNAFCQTMEALAGKDTEEALRHSHEMEGYMDSIPERKIDAYSMRAEIYYQAGRLPEALACLDSVGATARELGDLWYDMQIERSRSSLFAAMGMKSRADSCLFRYYDLRERLFEDRSAKRIKDLHFLGRIDNVMLQMQKITLERQYARVLSLIALVVSLIFAGMLILLIRSHRRLKESHRRIFEEYTRKLEQEGKTRSVQEIVPYAVEIHPDDMSESAHDDADPCTTEEKYRSSSLTEEEKDILYSKIRQVLSESEAVLSNRYQIKDMAAEAEMSPRVISQVINERAGVNFATFLAEYRINTACRRINESATFRRLTIDAMAASVGIQSRSYFSTTFKKIVGLNPSEYIRQAEMKAD